VSAPRDRQGRYTGEIPPTRRGYVLGEVSSALQKSIRRCDADGAAYWVIELSDSGCGEYAWHRLRTCLSEDVGLADRHLPATIAALYEAWQQARARRHGGDGRMHLVHAAMLLATARKSRIVCHATIVLSAEGRRSVPDEALDMHTLAGKKRGRGFEHFFEEAALLADPTGELTAEGALPDPYLRARQALERKQTDQLTIEGEWKS
jgi:replication-associated recombination protein RarA